MRGCTTFFSEKLNLQLPMVENPVRLNLQDSDSSVEATTEQAPLFLLYLILLISHWWSANIKSINIANYRLYSQWTQSH